MGAREGMPMQEEYKITFFKEFFLSQGGGLLLHFEHSFFSHGADGSLHQVAHHASVYFTLYPLARGLWLL